MSEINTTIKLEFTYYNDPVTLYHLKQMIPVTQTDYDSANDVWRLPYQIVLRSTRDGRYYCMNKGETDFEYRCIIAEEYYKGEPYEGVVIGFVIVEAEPITEQALTGLLRKPLQNFPPPAVFQNLLKNQKHL